MNGIRRAKIDPSHLTACHGCDLLVEKQDMLPGNKAICPRCGSPLYEPKSDTVNRTLAVVITGLILFVPANFLPILTMTVLGQTSDNTLIAGVIGLYREGYYWVSFLVLCFSMAAPLLKLFSLLIVLFHVKFHVYSRHLAVLFRFCGMLNEWAMVEVYMVAILIAVIKLGDMAKVHIGLGLCCFVGLLLTSTLASVNLDEDQMWEAIEGIGK